jgi:hypothetical protein
MRFAGFGILSLTALIAASSFTAIPQPAQAAKICPAIFMPVCAVGWHGVRKTYSNSCEAGRSHARVLHAGDCIAPSPSSACFRIFLPVCAIDPRTHKRHTYPNSCDAEVANATLVSEGACP